MSKVEDVVYLLAMDGTPLRVLPNDTDTQVESVLGAQSVLSTTVDFATDVKTEMQLVWRNNRYIITDVEYSRQSGRRVLKIEAESVFMELSNAFADIEQVDSSVNEIMRALLRDTRWTVGKVDTALGGDHSMTFKDRDSSVLAALRLLERFTDGALKLQFDTLNFKVHMVDARDLEYDVLFAYGRNTESVTKQEFAPKATRIIPKGNGDLGIENVTDDGVDYVENYDYYIAQGYTLEEARKLFTKVTEFTDERYLLAGNLMREAQRRLETLAFPQVTYSTTIAYIDQPVSVGVTGYVQDEEMGIRVKAEIVRIIEKKDSSESEVELNYLIPGTGDLQEARTESSAGAKVALNRLQKKFTSSTDMYFPVIELQITNIGAANLNAGFNLQIEASSDTGVIFDGYFDIDGARTGHIVKQSLGKFASVGFPFVITDIMEGSHIIRLMAKSEGGTFTVDKNRAELYVESETLMSGHAPSIPVINVTEEVEFIPAMFVDEDVTVELTDVPEEETE